MACEGTSLGVYGKKTVIVGNREIQVKMIKDNGKVVVQKNFTGHLSPVTQILKIKKKESEGCLFLSSSVDDRFIYAW